MRKITLFIISLLIATTSLQAAESTLLNQIAQELNQVGGQRGFVWDLTNGNELPPGWIIPTTDRIPGKLLAESIRDLIGGAQQTVDITAMAPTPDGAFYQAIVDGVKTLAAARRQVTVRMLIGNANPISPVKTHDVAKELLAIVKGTPVTVFIGAVSSCVPPAKCTGANGLIVASTNHSKIVAVDGKEAIVGGHNLWSTDYTDPKPIYDLSMRVRGPAAFTAANFAAHLWSYTCSNNRHGIPAWLTYVSSVMPYDRTPDVQGVCSFYPQMNVPAGPGTVPILTVARSGAGVSGLPPAFSPSYQWSDLAMRRVLESAQSTIRISQQDLMTTTRALNQPAIEAVAKLIARGNPGEVYIMMTNQFATSPGTIPTPYSFGVSPMAVGGEIKKVVARQMGLPANDPSVRQRVCTHLHLGSIARFGEDGKPTNFWGPVRRMGNHSKMYMVDDHVFYIGSHNMYPITVLSSNPKDWNFLHGSLQELGYVVDDERAAKELIEKYWNPIWEPTRALSVSGDGHCSIE
jgi:phosphatidylserine/phosphatidylglycerophosphate/cardiolipin synthase-like enzyme